MNLRSRHDPRVGSRSGRDRDGERGQVLVLFALFSVVLIGGTGLVIDGGSAFVQRREQQAAADFAALAGGIAYANTAGSGTVRVAAAHGKATQVAAVNGYTAGTVGGVVTAVTVTVDYDAGSKSVVVTANIARNHRNSFAAIFPGQETWPVSAQAKVLAGIPNSVLGVMPLIFNKKAFDDERPRNMTSPGILYDDPGSGNQDVPQDSTTFNWTTFCKGSAVCNGDSTTVNNYITGGGIQTVVQIGDRIAPLNAGAHTKLFQSLEQWIGRDFPVALVDNDGRLMGFVMFRIDSVQGGSDKVLGGWFVGDAQYQPLSIVTCGARDCAATSGTHIIKLTD
jgi:Flp pilus assembly protein TadG